MNENYVLIPVGEANRRYHYYFSTLASAKDFHARNDRKYGKGAIIRNLKTGSELRYDTNTDDSYRWKRK
jgi:hypothetical protein